MELFVEPFNPTMYSDAKKPLSRANSLNNALESLPVNQALLEKSVKSAFSRQRVRDLVVDLREPKFRNISGPLNFAVQPNRTVTKNFAASTSSLPNLKANLVEMDYEIMYHLFCPPAMDKKVFQIAMKALMIMTVAGEDNSIQIQAGRPSVNGNNSLQMSLKDVNLLQGGDGHFIITPSEIVVYPGCHPLQLYQEYLLLNPGQREALHKVLFCEDYVLLWGLPGTGKTYTLALIVRMIVSRQETVLLTSYTHNAVDHIMEKLMGKGMNTHHVMRINSSSAPSSNVNTESPNLSNPSIGLIAAFKKRISSVRVFVATILAVSRHVLFKSQHIHCSFCVIDEAGQITTPVILAGLMHSHKFILSGDDYQLPPLILSQEAAKKGMAVSLLKQLMSIHPHAVSTLYIQYRMNDSIMSLCNRLVYEDRMLCGTPEVANRRLLLPSIHTLPMPFGASQPADVTERTDWLFQALSPHYPVVMLNTDALPSLEKHSLNDSNSTSGSSVENISDGLIIKALLIGLLDFCQLPVTNDTAIITPFRAQMTLLQQLLHTTGSPTTDNNNGNNGNMALLKRYVLHNNNFDISTVDKYQGKDRDVVIFNTVKKIKNLSNANAINANEGSAPVDSVGTLLRDWRRINVALTR
jgi:DNA replication ATP-dependent helicase Dna2